MPYIEKYRRDNIGKPETAGELNFMITELLISYMETNGLNYATINDIVGACEGAKMEFYRRVAVPYKDIKIAENGDVY